MHAIRRALNRVGRPALTRQLSTATSSNSTVLQQWINSAPSNVLYLEDHVTLSRVRSLVSTIEVSQDGLASVWSTKGDILPPGWTLLFFPPWDSTTSSLAPDGTEKTPHHPPLEGGLDERMWVGGSFAFARGYQTPNSGQGIRIGSEIECKAKVLDVKKKMGKDGRPGYYVQVQREIRERGEGTSSEATGTVAVKETRVHIYRPSMTDEQRQKVMEANSPSLLKNLDARRHEADFVMPFLPTPKMLMRFSALTFNTHRIHWDERYCKEVEGREGLIVHGPLTALLLLNTFRHNLPRGEWEGVKDFTYRNTAPLVVDRKVAFCGKWKGEDCELWVEQEDGLIVMTGVGRGWKKGEK
ncbi:hypothetical protein MVLG_01663 [Microbotryum lychnidis-dioicae p1A1 Lamole]|uniref:N-terminal of MaoC-like dehydratase domain-containing protein n=1 Tax=Microbotryum lychnidis-dioicae (strain p1A1 Lamole / MvSl-1064) TaxID=683840 RepID=U5H2T1_USTV1|nr:hypothetical protein MVLG_01663 [Microbotryum lychnidis-dioicae p1A1 Lamole]|eukprot:KDE08184.1 hypothetical protein MVLG_01663 [Microbotryum lychnidis-dioicae p1A1 Lamole]